jgi:predicted nuclease of restriction endonuclease-like (RecB) superfamily
LPWFHIVTLLTKVSDDTSREWYAARAIAEGWSRPALEAHIKNQLHRRQGAALTNFDGRSSETDVGVHRDPRRSGARSRRRDERKVALVSGLG